MKKIYCLCIAIIIIVFSAPMHLTASELDYETVDTEKIKLKLTYVTVRISDERFYIRSETENSAKVDIIDKKKRANSRDLWRNY